MDKQRRRFIIAVSRKRSTRKRSGTSTVSASGLREKREKAQRLAREYNQLAKEYNELSRKNWSAAQKRTAAGEAAAKRLVRAYNKLAAKGQQLEKAMIAYRKARGGR